MRILICSALVVLMFGLSGPAHAAVRYQHIDDVAAARQQQTPKFRGNRTTGVYHNSRCRHFDCRDCTIPFASRDAAKKAGFKACKTCGG